MAVAIKLFGNILFVFRVKLKSNLLFLNLNKRIKVLHKSWYTPTERLKKLQTVSSGQLSPTVINTNDINIRIRALC